MKTSDASWSPKLRLIGDIERPDHGHLSKGDACAFFGEYTARAGYAHSDTNQIIHNLKKKPETRGTSQWRYKLEAIAAIGRAIAANINPDAFADTAFIPIPPSKPPGHPEYDDRMLQVAQAIGPARGVSVDVREALRTRTERAAAHVTQNQRDPVALKATLETVPAALISRPRQIVLLDDVLTTGCSFIVCREILQGVWPDIPIFGLFAARRIIDAAAAFGFVDETGN